MTPFNGLEPVAVWNHFEAFTQIVRPSKGEKIIADYIRAWAVKYGHTVADTADSGNVIVRVAATKGRTKESVLILQGHLDMVCLPESTTPAGNNPRLGKITVVRDREWIRAADTTLGADNGVGVAMILAAVEDSGLEHGPLELLFTVEEEDGLIGAGKVLPAQLISRTLLNLDSETLNEITIGSAGGRDTIITLEHKSFTADNGEASWKLSLTGLRGGHSGVEINAGRLNAIHGLARTLRGMGPLRLCDFTATGRRNAIASAASAVILSAELQATLEEAVDAAAATLRAQFPDETSLDLKLTSETVIPAGWTASDSGRAVALLQALPAGVFGMSQKLKGIVETSSNIGVVRTTTGANTTLTIECSSRSMIRSGLDDITGTLAALAELAGGKVTMSEPYPGWNPNPASTVLKRLVDSYKRVNGGAELHVQAVHAGLECGILADRLPGLDAVSFGPTVESPHSTSERVLIDSVGVAFNVLRDVLKTSAGG